MFLETEDWSTTIYSEKPEDESGMDVEEDTDDGLEDSLEDDLANDSGYGSGDGVENGDIDDNVQDNVDIKDDSDSDEPMGPESMDVLREPYFGCLKIAICE